LLLGGHLAFVDRLDQQATSVTLSPFHTRYRGDTTRKYDAATIWLDNRQIEGKITVMAIAGGGVLGD
jgi:hypothetical protein